MVSALLNLLTLLSSLQLLLFYIIMCELSKVELLMCLYSNDKTQALVIGSKAFGNAIAIIIKTQKYSSVKIDYCESCKYDTLLENGNEQWELLKTRGCKHLTLIENFQLTVKIDGFKVKQIKSINSFQWPQVNDLTNLRQNHFPKSSITIVYIISINFIF